MVYININTNGMNAARLLGLLQSDGHFGFFWDKDKTFRPRIYLTAGEPNKYLLDDIVIPWLKSQNIKYLIHKHLTNRDTYSYNLVIERQKQVSAMIALLDEATKKYPTLLVDDKLFQFLAMKECFRLTKIKNKFKTQAERAPIYKKLVDLKIKILKINAEQTRKNIPEERYKYEQRLGVKNTKGKANDLWISLKKEANQKSQALVNQLITTGENCTNCSFELGEYIMGIMDGDGSVQVGFHVKR
jgi:hypothetical protein